MKQNKEQVSTPSSYNKYRDLCLGANLTPKPKPIYLKIVNGFFKFIISKVLEGEQVKLPSRTGILFVVGKKSLPKTKEDGTLTGLAPDWHKTKLLRESNPEAKEKRTVLYHLNEHSGGMRYRYFWSKKNIVTENQTFYSLRISWSNKKALSKLVFAGKEYINEKN